MIKVIGEDESAKLRHTCKNCAAILEFTRNEMEIQSSRDLSGCVEEYKTITCPRCHSVEIPKRV